MAQNREMILELRSSDEKETRIECGCVQNCVDSNVYIQGYKVLVDTNSLLGTISAIALVKEYPLVRFKRRILFSLTDFFGKYYLQ